MFDKVLEEVAVSLVDEVTKVFVNYFPVFFRARGHEVLKDLEVLLDKARQFGTYEVIG